MLLVCTSASAQSYTITDLGSLADLTPSIPTITTSSGNAINQAGAIAGGSSISGGCIVNGPSQICEPVVPHAFFWQNGIIQDLSVIGSDVGIDQFPRPESIAWSINSRNQTAGEGTRISDFFVRGWAHLPTADYGIAAGMHELPRLHTMARARSINDSGIIAGEANTPSFTWKAVQWQPSRGSWSIVDLSQPSWVSSFANGINNHHQVTGTFGVGAPTNNSFAFLYLPEPAYGLPAGMHTVTPGLTSAIGNSINDLGQIAGTANVAQPMIWLPEPAYNLPAGATVFSLSSMFSSQYLAANGFLFVLSAEFKSLNTHGTGVGNVTFGFLNQIGGTSFTTRGFVWKNNQFRLAKDFLPINSSWTQLNSANSINDADQITGSGFLTNGQSHGYLLQPEQVCEAADLNCDGMVNVDDLVMLLGAWGACPAKGACQTDLAPPPAGDGQVNVDDLVILLGNWG